MDRFTTLVTTVTTTVGPRPLHLYLTCNSTRLEAPCLRYTSERKQISSWLTHSWNPFTTPAVRNPGNGKIIAVIKNSYVYQWSDEETDIDKVKKKNFSNTIHKLIVKDETVFVVFDNGAVQTLSNAIATRKEEKSAVIGEGETILHTHISNGSEVITMVTLTKEGEHKAYLLSLKEESTSVIASQNITNKTLNSKGFCILSTGEIICLWSDSSLALYNWDTQNQLTFKNHLYEAEELNPRKSVRILQLSSTHIGILGMDASEEGGKLILVDIKFGLVTSSKKLKMYRNPPLAWNTGREVILTEGGSLAAVPFTLTVSNLATVFGSRTHENMDSLTDTCLRWPLVSYDWEIKPEATMTIFSKKSEGLSKIIQMLKLGSVTEDVVAKEVTAHTIQLKDVDLVEECVRSFEQFPESCIVDVLSFYMQHGEGSYDNDNKDEAEMKESINPFNEKQMALINGVLSKPFTDIQLLAELPRLSFSLSLKLIKYLQHLITEGQAPVEKSSDETCKKIPLLQQLCIWLSLLLDTNYHQLVMTSEISIHKLLLTCLNEINTLRTFVENMVDIEPLARRIMEAKTLPVNQAAAPYSIERLMIPL
ncbi:nucleolar protein 11 isoform X2 [Oratosquilla oratoria]|uniref:nucleolar protein 11 isoform X2 n=1 Tax=Oratosquilla oratoria TaxID=337810 RepID=UPI003F7654BA